MHSLKDIDPILMSKRMIKSQEELQLACHAEEVASSMLVAGQDRIQDGFSEFEVVLAIVQAGTRKTAEILLAHYDEIYMSPTAQVIEIISSGK